MTPGDEVQSGESAGGGDSSTPASGPQPGYDIPSGGGAGEGSPSAKRWNETGGDVQALHSAAASSGFNDRACGGDGSRASGDGDRGPMLSVADQLNQAALGGGVGTSGGSPPAAHGDLQGAGSDQIRQRFDQANNEAQQFLDDSQAGGQKTDEALKVLQEQQEKNRVFRDLGEEKAGDPTDATHTSREEAHERSKLRTELADRGAHHEPLDQMALIGQAFQKHIVERFNVHSLRERSLSTTTGASAGNQLELIRQAWDRHGKESPDQPERNLDKPSAAPKERFLPGFGGRRLTDGKTASPRRGAPAGHVREAWNGGKWLKEYRKRLAESYRMMGAKQPPVECR